MKEGNLAYLRGDYETAIAHYEQAISTDPGRARIHLNEGYSFMALARASADSAQRCAYAAHAIQSFSLLLDPDVRPHPGEGGIPSQDRIESYVMTLLLDTQQREEAARRLAVRIDQHPRDFAAMQLLSNLCVEMGTMQEALSWQERCLAEQADLPEAHYSLAMFAWRLAHYDEVTDAQQRDAVIERGLQASSRALELRPRYFEALTCQNLLYREKARHVSRPRDRKSLEELAIRAETLAREIWKSSEAVLDSTRQESLR
jgi:tetratricopeptide (TPR) repeat protein